VHTSRVHIHTCVYSVYVYTGTYMQFFKCSYTFTRLGADLVLYACAFWHLHTCICVCVVYGSVFVYVNVYVWVFPRTCLTLACSNSCLCQSCVLRSGLSMIQPQPSTAFFNFQVCMPTFKHACMHAFMNVNILAPPTHHTRTHKTPQDPTHTRTHALSCAGPGIRTRQHVDECGSARSP
jgi:hypothetical protein